MALHSRYLAMESGAAARMSAFLNRSATQPTAAQPGRRPGSLAREATTGVFVLPIHGVIAHRASQARRWSWVFGTSVEHIRADLRAAMADSAIHTIVLDVDSPGGVVFGMTELATEIREARKQKRIIAGTDSMMASAAYWLASQATTVYATASAQVGSIGVIASFYDTHRADANAGYDQVTVRSVPAKGIGQRNGSIGDADLARIQADIDAYHAMFVDDVAAGRRIDLAKAQRKATGDLLMARQAQAAGLIDDVRMLSDVLELAAAPPSKAKAKAK